MLLPRWNPVGEIVSFQDEMDPLFEQELARALNSLPAPEDVGPPFPIIMDDQKDCLTIRVDLREVKFESIDTSYIGHELKIKGEFQVDQGSERERDSYHQPTEKFVHFIELPANVDPSIIHSSLRNGILEISIPKRRV